MRRTLLGVLGAAFTVGVSIAAGVSCTSEGSTLSAYPYADAADSGSQTPEASGGEDAGDATTTADSAVPSKDGASDAGLDSAVADAVSDTGRDAPVDGLDSGLDAGFDSGVDAGSDAGLEFDGAPFVLALDQPYPTEISAGGGYVYWTNSTTTGNVMMLSLATVLAGGTPTPTLVANEYLPRGIVVSPALGAAYWATYGDGFEPGSGSITMAPLGSTTTTVLASTQLGSSELAVDSTNLFWLNGGTGVIQSNDLSRMTLDGGAPTALTTLNDSAVGHVATDSVNVYWSTANSTILALPVNAAASATPVTAANQSDPQGLVTDGTRLYWISGGNVESMPLLGADLDAGPDGGTVTTLASAGSQATGYLAVDGAYVYWTDQGALGTANEGTVKKVSVTGGNPITIASGLTSPLGIAVDDQLVYWTSSSAGTVEAAPK